MEEHQTTFELSVTGTVSLKCIVLIIPCLKSDENFRTKFCVFYSALKDIP